MTKLFELRTICGRVSLNPEHVTDISELVPEAREQLEFLNPNPMASMAEQMKKRGIDVGGPPKREDAGTKLARLQEWGVTCAVRIASGMLYYVTEPYESLRDRLAKARGGVDVAPARKESQNVTKAIQGYDEVP